ncbi:hypothetical protein ANN_22097 [Periplaneta americana]|uniref:Uncharacterized protein n=1 Tax=Periplaneta americana TaxID=6978 RepID=A0ABQ8S7H6_PERAM|nr:hypothetical protein ANN_22097 [Periplaneta americana]
MFNSLPEDIKNHSQNPALFQEYVPKIFDTDLCTPTMIPINIESISGTLCTRTAEEAALHVAHAYGEVLLEHHYHHVSCADKNYAEHYSKIMEVIDAVDSTDSSAVTAVKSLPSEQLLEDIVFTDSNLKIVPKSITLLESSKLQLSEALNIVDKVS